ncbi:MAG: [ribosomal protein S18]-alanine N-acetyltransferase [Acidobacteriota bacterium]|nr:[ribosomal protein S18]-alanine N-acetyltransferase [Acidobacteriota bacterium]
MARVSEAYEIAEMSAHDLLEVVEIEETCGLSRWGWDSYHEELTRPESIMLVARRNSLDATGKQLHGFVAARLGADELHVNNIGVLEVARRQGIGTALLARATERGQLQGAQSVLLEVRASNESALMLYLRQGFEIVGRRRNYYHDPTEDALVMRKALRSTT